MLRMIESIATRLVVLIDQLNHRCHLMLIFEKCSASDIVMTSTFEYMSCVGALLYLALTVRPDITFAVGQLSRCMSCPTPGCVRLTKQCVNYLYVTRDLGVTFK